MISSPMVDGIFFDDAIDIPNYFCKPATVYRELYLHESRASGEWHSDPCAL